MPPIFPSLIFSGFNQFFKMFSFDRFLDILKKRYFPEAGSISPERQGGTLRKAPTLKGSMIIMKLALIRSPKVSESF